MIVTYLRSSSISQFDYCQMQYFINYVLGWRPDSNHKANKGTAVHGMLERIAKIKLAVQQGKNYIDDDILGKLSFSEQDMYTTKTLSVQEVDIVNSSRINKTIYPTPCDISYGHTRIGVDLAEHVFEKVYDYYAKNSGTEWSKADKRDCLNWMWIILDYNNGLYDPRKRKVYDIEGAFDITIEHDWAKFNYGGVTGNLGIKGTIDLILVDERHDILEAVDWKTGQRLIWATMQRKEYQDFAKDTQLMLYFYAISKKYDVEGIMSTIFYVRDGGPFSVMFDQDTVPIIEKKLKDRFNEIRNCDSPKMFDKTQKSFKCKTLCHYKKNDWPDTDQNMCRFIHDEIKRIGIDKVTEKYSRPGHDINHYQSPGDVE